MIVILIEEVAFDDFDGQTILLAPGTRVQYDPIYNIALWDSYHFHLETFEFSPEH